MKHEVQQDHQLVILSLLEKTFILISYFLTQFPSSRAGKSGLKFDSEGWDDALFVPGFS